MAELKLTTEYKGYPIDYNEGTEMFRVFVDGTVGFKNPSLRGLKMAIDNFEKAQSRKDFKRFRVLVFAWQTRNHVEREVTSITEGGQYWISDGKNRSKESSVIPATESNIQKTIKMAQIKTEMMKLDREYTEIENSLDKLKDGARPKEE